MENEALLKEEVEPPGGSQHIFGSRAYTYDLFASYNVFTNQPVDIAGAVRRLSRFKDSPKSQNFRKLFYPHITLSEWQDWQWQYRNRIRDLRTLANILHLSPDEHSALNDPSGSIPVAITPFYASLLDRYDSAQALRRMVVPVMDERLRTFGESNDPLSEENDSPVPGIVHRYPDRVLFLVTDSCSTYCRYCTRSRVIGRRENGFLDTAHWVEALSYIRSNRKIRDVLLSGGDPLTLSDAKLEWLLSRLKKISHVEIIRIGTKVPVVLPQRITSQLTCILKRFHPLWMSIHVNHPDELTPEMSQACVRLANAGLPLGSQTVLLKKINDDINTMKRLVHGLLKIRVKPYYLYQCDPIPGSSHFRTHTDTGLEIIKGLRGHTTGYAVPTYVVDAPGGGGKIPLLPQYSEGRDDHHLILKNYQGRTFYYPECRLTEWHSH